LRKPLSRLKQILINKVKNISEEIGILDRETVAQNRDRWKLIRVAEIAINYL
jgi:hypothetical protein